MTRAPSNALHLWQIPDRPDGDVRLLGPAAGKRSYRLIWRENGLQRERTSTSLDTAMALGLEQATLLACMPGEPGPNAPFSDALAHHLDFEARGVRWSVKYQRRLNELVRRWFDDALLTLPCRAFEPPHGRAAVMDLLDRLQTAGYPRGSHEYEQMGALLSGLFKSGISVGYFTTNPMSGEPGAAGAVAAHATWARRRPGSSSRGGPSARAGSRWSWTHPHTTSAWAGVARTKLDHAALIFAIAHELAGRCPTTVEGRGPRTRVPMARSKTSMSTGASSAEAIAA